MLLPGRASVHEPLHPLNRCSSETWASSSSQDRQIPSAVSVRARQAPRRKIPRAAVKLEASTAKAEEEHRVRLEQLYEEGVETHESIDAPSRLHNLQQLYSIWNHSLAVQLKSAPPRNPKSGGPGSQKDGEYFVNVGNAIRTLRSEIPFLFQRDFTYDIYRDDIVFRDPRNTFRGLKNYKTIFWSLRFHGKLFFKFLFVDVQRIWQPDDSQIKMRWTVRGIPRVPWNAEGVFDGISTFRLDNKGKVYEHQVDNVILRDPPMQRSPLFVGLDLTPLLQPQQQPCPGGYFQPLTLQLPKSMEALLRAQGAAPEQEESSGAQSTAQHAEQAQSGSTLQQLSDILRRDAQWLRENLGLERGGRGQLAYCCQEKQL